MYLTRNRNAWKLKMAAVTINFCAFTRWQLERKFKHKNEQMFTCNMAAEFRLRTITTNFDWYSTYHLKLVFSVRFVNERSRANDMKTEENVSSKIWFLHLAERNLCWLWLWWRWRQWQRQQRWLRWWWWYWYVYVMVSTEQTRLSHLSFVHTIFHCDCVLSTFRTMLD